MAENKILNDSQLMAVPPLRMTLGERSANQAKGKTAFSHLPAMPKEDLEIPVRRLIAHLEQKVK
jgi:hypothetical protein